MGKGFAKLILIVEVLLLAAMLLADFGVIKSSVEPLSTKGIMLHLSVVILIIGSAIGLRRANRH